MRVIDSPQVSDYRETTALAVAVHVMQIDIKRTRTKFQNIAKNVLDAGLPLTLENLDKFYDIPIAEGWDLHRSYENDMKMNVTDRCTFATVWVEKNWAEVGHIYCLIDIAIREGYSSNVKFCPVKNILEGDPHCQSLTVYRDISKKGQ